MLGYDSYIFLLCLLVFLSLTIVFTAMTVELTSSSIRLIRTGAEDKQIKKNYRKLSSVKKRHNHSMKWITGIISVIVIVLFGFSIYVNVAESGLTERVSVVRAVQSGSMSKKHSDNKYLFENNLNNQFSTFDLIVTHKMPAENELQLYDIVVYEIDGIAIVHRIVGIEEPNEKHPDCRYFLLQGDAVGSPDRFPVLYKQMKGIYKGQKLPFVGSFILFLQSPAGYMCIALIFLVNVALPLMERKIDKEEKNRLAFLLRSERQSPYLFFQQFPNFMQFPSMLYPAQYFIDHSTYNEATYNETRFI